MKKQIVVDLITTLLMAMFFYTAFSKYLDFAAFQRSMQNQHLNSWITRILIFGLPPVEIIVGGLLIIPGMRQVGLTLSMLLMIVFTGYVGLILMGAFTNSPCPCGGVLKEMTWDEHFVFNALFLVMAISGTILQHHINRKNQLKS